MSNNFFDPPSSEEEKLKLQEAVEKEVKDILDLHNNDPKNLHFQIESHLYPGVSLFNLHIGVCQALKKEGFDTSTCDVIGRVYLRKKVNE